MFICQQRIQGVLPHFPEAASFIFYNGIVAYRLPRVERLCLINPGSATAFYTTESFLALCSSTIGTYFLPRYI